MTQEGYAHKPAVAHGHVELVTVLSLQPLRSALFVLSDKIFMSLPPLNFGGYCLDRVTFAGVRVVFNQVLIRVTKPESAVRAYAQWEFVGMLSEE